MTPNTLPLRPNVCMIVLNSAGLIFLGQRHGEAGKWQFPQGGAEPDLSLEENVLRELTEELGAPRDLFAIIKKLNSTHEYEFMRPPDYAKGRWRGQSQTFWLVQFRGADSDINLKAHIPEFDDFKWCTLEEVRKLSEPIRLKGYDKALTEVKDELLKRVSPKSKN